MTSRCVSGGKPGARRLPSQPGARSAERRARQEGLANPARREARASSPRSLFRDVAATLGHRANSLRPARKSATLAFSERRLVSKTSPRPDKSKKPPALSRESLREVSDIMKRDLVAGSQASMTGELAPSGAGQSGPRPPETPAYCWMVGEVGLEPTKAKPADLQSAPFAARDTPPHPSARSRGRKRLGGPEARSGGLILRRDPPCQLQNISS